MVDSGLQEDGEHFQYLLLHCSVSFSYQIKKQLVCLVIPMSSKLTNTAAVRVAFQANTMYVYIYIYMGYTES